MQNNTTFLPKINTDSALNSVAIENTPQLSYFDTITQRLDSWHAKQQAIRDTRAQLVKTTIIKETDPVTSITRTYRLSCELISSENGDALELHEQEPEMEVSSYVS